MNCKNCRANCTGAKQDREIALCLGYDPPKTNADRIRAMTDEELADSFASRCCPVKDEFYNCGEINKKEFSWEDCKSCWRDWLKSPVEVDNG